MVQKVIIAIDPKLDNFACLGNRLHVPVGDNTYDVIIHNDPKVNQNKGGPKINFDVYIDGVYDRKFNWADFIPPENIRQRKRYPKDVQTIKLARFYEDDLRQVPDSKETRFINIPSWFVGWNNKNYPTGAGRVVVKSLDGARGVGQFTVDTSRVNLNYFCAELNRLLDGELTPGCVERLLEPFKECVVYGRGGENYENEGLEAMKNQGYFVQSLIANVANEYRVLTNGLGVPEYFQRRTVRDKDSKFPQATGGGALIDAGAILDADKFYIESGVDRDYFERLCEQLIGPISSIDIFSTRDAGWGIFEYCNQFGISGVPDQTAFDLHLGYIKILIAEMKLNGQLE